MLTLEVLAVLRVACQEVCQVAFRVRVACLEVLQTWVVLHQAALLAQAPKSRKLINFCGVVDFHFLQ